MKALRATILGAAALMLAAQAASAQTQPPGAAPPQPPRFQVTKVEGTDNVYIFRAIGHLAMFVVTPAGVIATDPIAYVDKTASTVYLQEIEKITKAPVRYVIYSHHHYDHIAGGQPFKAKGAVFVAHRNAKGHLDKLKNPEVVPVDLAVGDRHTITLGGTRVELRYVGKNHSDNSLVVYLPKEKIIFAVDFIPIQSVLFRNMLDSWIPDWEQSLERVLAIDWTRMIAGHPGPGGRMIGTKDDVRALLGYMRELSAEAKKAADARKCWDTAQNEIQLPKYQSWGGYAQFFKGNIERYCSYWARGY